MMNQLSSRVLLIAAAFMLFLVPVAAIAAGGFTDVDDNSVFKADITWLADAGVTKGCNPPTNDKFCPKGNVTREQMAAFMHRLAVNQVVDAGTVEGMTAAELKGQKGDTGPAGPQGETGPPGGVLGFYTQIAVKEVPVDSYDHWVIANCLPGDAAVGGATATGIPSTGLFYGPLDDVGPATDGVHSGPLDVPNGWLGHYHGDPDRGAILEVRVVCADMTP